MTELTKEQKEQIVEEINNAPDEGLEEGNTETFTLNDIDPKAADTTPQEQYDKCVAMNARSLAVLDSIFEQKKVSSKNMRKLIFATLKLPESGATLKFGGTEEQKQVCEFAYAQMQLAANTRAFIMGVNAMREQRKAMKQTEEEAQKAEKPSDNSPEGAGNELL